METLTDNSPAKNAIVALILIAAVAIIAVVIINQADQTAFQVSEDDSPSISTENQEAIELTATDNN